MKDMREREMGSNCVDGRLGKRSQGHWGGARTLALVTFHGAGGSRLAIDKDSVYQMGRRREPTPECELPHPPIVLPGTVDHWL